MVKYTNDLRDAYSNNEIHDVGDVAISLVTPLPVIGSVVEILTKTPDEPFNIRRGVQSINNNLHILNRDIQNVGKKIEKLGRKVEFSIVPTEK